jgi:hypothetical protein
LVLGHNRPEALELLKLVMKLTSDQLEAAVYIFEREHGNTTPGWERRFTAQSGLSDLQPKEVEKIIVDGLNAGIYDSNPDRTIAYWALGKRFNRSLITDLRKWLWKELDLNAPDAVYQLLISLDNLDEPVFHPDRNGGYALHETELNLRDARNYLRSYTSENARG